MKRCNRCGAKNMDGSNFCQDCGTRLNDSKPVRSHDKNLIERFMDASIFLKLIIIIIAVFVFLVAFAWIGHIFFGFPLESYTEGDATYRPSQFDSLDVDGDGALSFYEVESLASDIPYDNLLDIFDAADKNDNGVLKGAEFDGYLYRIDRYYKELEKQQRAEEEKAAQQKSSSSSSSSSKSKSVEYIEACPECGSQEIFEYDDSYGNRVYQCSVCDFDSYDDDDFVVEVSSSKCIFPALMGNLAITSGIG